MTAPHPVPRQRGHVGRVVGASTIGTTVEWYDFFLYDPAAALVFGPLFFPEQDDSVGVLAAFATCAIGFGARPIGGLVFGHFGDRIGRKELLVISLLMMGGATVAIVLHRGSWASWPQAGAPAGQLLSTGVLAVLAAFQSDEAFAS
jgi:MFS family permease